MRLFVLGNAQRPGVIEEAERLLPYLRQRADVVVFDLHQEVDLSAYEADMTLVLGGDGAILRAARQMGYHQVPVLGINLGRLGFLADVSLASFRDCFEQVLEGNYRVTEHLMFEWWLGGADGQAGQPAPYLVRLGLNEVALQPGPPFHMLELDLIINGEPVARYSGDGLIVSTPVGCTGHGLSAGGPILGQELSAFVLTPICPHTLTARPVVDSADKVYTVAVRRATCTTFVNIDGQEHYPVSEGQHVSVQRAPVTFKLVKTQGRSFYQNLHEKLNWGAQPNYRPEPGRESERSNC